MYTLESSKEGLEHFLSFPLSSSTDVLNEFSKLPGAISCFNGDKNNYVYIPGTRKDRVVLVAHADTVWDSVYLNYKIEAQTINFKKGIYYGNHSHCGIGADDRAGCAILWLLKDMGHSLLVVDGEEHGQIGSNHIRSTNPDLYKELNNHSYMIQFDRRGRDDYKCYKLPVTEKFKKFIEEATGYHDAGRTARTDIVALCENICGVNLSVGYYDEHSSYEFLVFDEWFHTLNIVHNLLKEKQERYPLADIDNF